MKKRTNIGIIISAVAVSFFVIIFTFLIIFIGLGFIIDSLQPTYVGGDKINLKATSVSPEEIPNKIGPYLVKVYIKNEGYALADEIEADVNSAGLNLNKNSLDLIGGDGFFEWSLNPGSSGYFEVPINPVKIEPGNYSIDLIIKYEDDETNNFIEYEKAVITIVN